VRQKIESAAWFCRPLRFAFLAALVGLLFAGYPGASAGSEPALARDSSDMHDPPEAPTRVEVGVYLHDLSEINDTAQSFMADFRLELRWRDSRLASPGETSARTVPLSSVWNPRLLVANDLGLRRHFAERATIAPDGSVSYLQRLSGELSCLLDLREFPSDSQEFLITLIARGYSSHEVKFEIIPEATGQGSQLTVASWSISTGKLTTGAVDSPLKGEPIPVIGYRVPGSREQGFYIWKVVIPIALIVMMSWSIFWIDPTDLRTQLAVSTGAVLTMVAFQLSLGDLLPRISYLTKLDHFVLSSTVIIFLAFAECVFTSALAKGPRTPLARSIDRACRWIFPLVLIGLLLRFLI